MKGIVLAGGLGTRLHPLTKVCNKSLLPVYDQPMIYYPIQTLIKSGIKDILIVCGGNSAGEFLRILENGEEFGLKNLHYAYQNKPLGIAHALGLAEEWASKEPVAVILSDNIFFESFYHIVYDFSKNPDGCVLFGCRSENPQNYGVIFFDEKGNITSIVEKPKHPKSNLVVTGLYLYDSQVWDFIKKLSPSHRGELEITDINNFYLNLNKLRVVELENFWIDCGENIDSLLDAGIKIRQLKSKK